MLIDALLVFPDGMSISEAIFKRFSEENVDFEGLIELFHQQDLKNVGDLRSLPEDVLNKLCLSSVAKSAMEDIRTGKHSSMKIILLPV